MYYHTTVGPRQVVFLGHLPRAHLSFVFSDSFVLLHFHNNSFCLLFSSGYHLGFGQVCIQEEFCVRKGYVTLPRYIKTIYILTS